MICCGRIEEISTQSDMQRVYLCTICGKQGAEDAFPEPQEPQQALRASVRATLWLSERIHRFADRISQY